MSNRRNGKRPPTVTMHDVAQLAGVSQGTVSRVLSQSNTAIPISEKTRKKVLDAIAKLNYQPNMMAQSLRTQRTYMIAMMIADISNAFYHSLVRSAQNIARQNHYDVLISDTDQLYENEKLFCDAVIRRAVDGVIIVPYQLSRQEIDTFIQRTGTAVVALGQHIEHPMVDVAYGDDERATYDAIRWLVQTKGHQRVGFIGVPEDIPPGFRRWRAYQNALNSLGIPLNPAWVELGDFSSESGYAAMQRLLAREGEKPSVVFACNDRMAIGAIGAAQDSGYRVPQDVGVMGFDNIPEATLIYPHLTTIAQHPEAIGKWLIESLLERIEGNVPEMGRRVEFPLEIIERSSV